MLFDNRFKDFAESASNENRGVDATIAAIFEHVNTCYGYFDSLGTRFEVEVVDSVFADESWGHVSDGLL